MLTGAGLGSSREAGAPRPELSPWVPIRDTGPLLLTLRRRKASGDSSRGETRNLGGPVPGERTGEGTVGSRQLSNDWEGHLAMGRIWEQSWEPGAPKSVQAEAVMPVDVDGGCRVGVGGEWTLRQRHDAELCAHMNGGDGQCQLPTEAHGS